LTLDGPIPTGPSKSPARGLTDEEVNAVTASEEFLDFVERSSKVIEKALDQDYDVLADYALDGADGIDEDEDEGYGSSVGKKGRRIKQVAQFYDERWSKKRMISDICFSPKVEIYCRRCCGTLLITSSSQSYSSHRTPRTLPHLKTLQAWSRYGTCTSTHAQNTHSTALPTSSAPSSPPSILPSSSVALTVGKSYFGTHAPGRLCQCRKRLLQAPRREDIHTLSTRYL
jgi:hypothetical protein